MNINGLFTQFIICLLIAVPLSYASDKDIENYGQLPKFSSMALSPDGKHYAYIRRQDETEYFAVTESSSGKTIVLIDVHKYKARSVTFIGNKHVLFKASTTQKLLTYRNAFEYSGAYVVNISTGKSRVLLKYLPDIHPAQSGLGRVLGFNEKRKRLYMPAFSNGGDRSSYNLYRVNINSGHGTVHARGNSSTIDWFVGEGGRLLAREDFDKVDGEHRIYSKTSGKWQLIYRKKTPFTDISVRAVSPDENTLIFVDEAKDNDALFSLSLVDGEITGPIYSQEGKDVDRLLTDINRKLIAVKYSGFRSEYDFFNRRQTAIFKGLQSLFPVSDVTYRSATSDKKLMIINVSGYEGAGAFKLLNTETMSLIDISSQYPDIEEIAELKAIRYRSRDGLKIPSIITLPMDTSLRKNLPLIVLPHSGPEAYDKLEFDWLAQFLAKKGYAVLQANFRGSFGFGVEHLLAGRGEWGRGIQNDISDGVKVLVDAGYVDPNRVCIMGSSFGGYSALAGGAFTPDLYRCVIAINTISDVPKMLIDYKRRYGASSQTFSYLTEIAGDVKSQRLQLEAISPVNFAQEFTAPVLLIYSSDDTVVPYKQSQNMYLALKKAGKDIEQVALKGEDHWLSKSKTRLQMLTVINEFLQKHNPAL